MPTKKNQKTRKVHSSNYRYRDEKGRLMSKTSAENKAKKLGFSHLQLQQFFDIKRKQAKNALTTVKFKKFWEKAKEIGAELQKPQDITITHAEFIRDYLTKHKGKAFLNGSRISKPNLAMFLSGYFSDFYYPIYLLNLEVYIRGNDMTLNLDNELHEKVERLVKKAEKSIKKKGDKLSLGGVSVKDKHGNEALLSSNP